ncbi:hypothetical protein SAMN02745171_01440 [Porphyromonas circumdentaria]|uniref:Uncharacterized protein n=1 Tax=Porphyromonas circumdentaria TaxID=29524 RepID=A0A1T4PFZ2_9PORP|nr:hypothetical protein [Porphyromonas circumdentaria]SJZ90237.1 hypothetical protein SAMN02745171_01440 [Porphyromonas circumdentaria]
MLFFARSWEGRSVFMGNIITEYKIKIIIKYKENEFSRSTAYR